MVFEPSRFIHKSKFCKGVFSIFNGVCDKKTDRYFKRNFRCSRTLQSEINPRKEVTATISVRSNLTGMCMPAIILGTWKADSVKVAERALTAALTVGYRAIDTSSHYGNEEVLGTALRTAMERSKLTRDNLFIIAKLPFNAMRGEKVKEYLCKSLKNLHIDYVDLYMINFPAGSAKNETGKYVPDLKVDHVSIWKAMEDMVDRGKTKYLGVCNFNSRQLNDLIACAKVMPSNVQVEINAYFQDEVYRQYAKDLNIPVTAYAPFGRSPGLVQWMEEKGVESKKPSPMNDQMVSSVARKLERSNGQVLIRYMLQLDDNLAVVIGGTDPKQICENFDIFTFCIDWKEYIKLKEIDRGLKGRSFDKDVFKLHFPGVEDSPQFPWKD